MKMQDLLTLWKNCLQSNRQEINPQPFGYIPYNISHSLNKALTNVKLYLEVLSLIVEAINSTDYANITEKCVHQVTIVVLMSLYRYLHNIYKLMEIYCQKMWLQLHIYLYVFVS
jgi:DNA integrity scanning protein DisA with diadenylate cyclase activity